MKESLTERFSLGIKHQHYKSIRYKQTERKVTDLSMMVCVNHQISIHHI